MKRTLITAAIAIAAVAPAVAQDATTFDGPYVGGQLGWQQDRGRVNATVVVPPLPPSVTPGVNNFTNRDTATGVAAGVFAGYNLPVGPNAVIGGEVGLDFGGGDINLNPFTPGNLVSPQRTITVTARGGVRLSSRSLVYVRGGYANARYNLEAGNNSVGTSRDGWTFGPGAEFLLNDNLSARVEYRHSDFGNPGQAFRALGFSNVNNGRLFRNQVLAGVSYQF